MSITYVWILITDYTKSNLYTLCVLCIYSISTILKLYIWGLLLKGMIYKQELHGNHIFSLISATVIIYGYNYHTLIFNLMYIYILKVTYVQLNTNTFTSTIIMGLTSFPLILQSKNHIFFRIPNRNKISYEQCSVVPL